MVSSCHTVLLAIITTEYAVGNDTDPGKYATMKHRVKSVTCRTELRKESIWIPLMPQSRQAPPTLQSGAEVYGLSNPLTVRKARRQGGCQGLNVERANGRIIRSESCEDSDQERI